VRRDGGAQQLHVTLAELREKPAGKATEDQESGEGTIGIALAPLDPASREALHLPRSTSGAVVAAVRPDSVAAEAGLQPGDVITAVGSHEVEDPEAAARAIREATQSPGAAVALRILREGHGAFVALQAPKNQG
jgi:serine protease Do